MKKIISQALDSVFELGFNVMALRGSLWTYELTTGVMAVDILNIAEPAGLNVAKVRPEDNREAATMAYMYLLQMAARIVDMLGCADVDGIEEFVDYRIQTEFTKIAHRAGVSQGDILMAMQLAVPMITKVINEHNLLAWSYMRNRQHLM